MIFLPLDRFDVKVLVLSRSVVRSHDSALESRSDSSREDTSKGVESSLVVSGHHLGDVHHKRGVRVTVGNTLSVSIIRRSFVQHTGSVDLRSYRGRQMHGDHLKKGLSSWQPFLHDDLEELFLLQFLVLTGELNSEFLSQCDGLLRLVVKAESEDLGKRRVRASLLCCIL